MQSLAELKLTRLQTLRQLQAEVEVRRRTAPRPRLWDSPGAMALDLDPLSTKQTAALDLIDAELVGVADDQCKRLMIFCPPQEGKSQRVSRRYPAWLLSQDPTLRIAIVSYAANKAERWGRQIRRDILAHPKLGIKLRADSRAAGRWETEEGGSLICVGIDGGITGEPVDVLLIDDPVRGRAEAESSTYRETAWDWWESNGSTRLSARGRVILMMTRWHEDDLAGRLLKNEPGKWRVVKIPAIAEANDPLGRQVGEELVSVQGRDPGHFKDLQKTRSPYVFLSVYQQRPTAAHGMIFKKIHWRYWRPAPQMGMTSPRIDLGGRIVNLGDCWRIGTVDLAASKRTSADYTVISAWAITGDGHVILLDRTRARLGEEEHFASALPLVQRWSLDTLFVEAGQFGFTLVKEATAAGVPISPLEADVDKTTRAIPAANRLASGRVWLPTGAWWTDEWVREHTEFPSTEHDDQVDTFAYAVRVAITKWAPTTHRMPGVPEIQPHPSGMVEPFGFGDEPPVDFLNVPM